MSDVHIAYDRETGRILSVHTGSASPEEARGTALRHAARYGPPQTAERFAILTVAQPEFDPRSRLRVDPARKVLLPAEPGETGVSFGFGRSGHSS